MKAADLPPKFQLALRRTVFFVLCLCIWLAFGTVAFSVLSSIGHRRADSIRMSRLDAKRTELLNVLWAETISKSENDWAEMANQKMEMYEKALLSSLGVRDDSNDKSYGNSMKKAFSLITTIGPLDIDDFSTVAKLFAVVFTIIGAPLCLNVVAQLGRMVTAIWEGRSVLLPTGCFIFASAVIYDIIEGGDDDVPFFDALFSIFLQFSTVGEEDNEFHGILPYMICLVGLALMSATFVFVQHWIERSVHGFELMFNRGFSGIERWLSEEKEEKETSYNNGHHVIEEEDEEEESDY